MRVSHGSGHELELLPLNRNSSTDDSLLSFLASTTIVDRVSNGQPRLSSTLKANLKGLCYALVPQLLRTRYFNDPLPPTKLNSTSWMNGLRGLAAIAVFNLHYIYAWNHHCVLGFEQNPNETWFFQLPPFPLFYDGTASVQVFFCIAGYVCSYRALENMTKRKYANLYNDLPASIFRRWFRLYLPPLLLMLIISLLAYIGAYESTRPWFKDDETRKEYFPGPMGEFHAARFPTLYLQVKEWWLVSAKSMNFWMEWNMDPVLDVHLWTILWEFRGSMHLYIGLIGLAWCKPKVRLMWLIALGLIYATQWRHYEGLCFFGGAAIAQMDVLRKLEDAKDSDKYLTRNNFLGQGVLGRFRAALRVFGYAFAVYLLSYPIRELHHSYSPLYKWMDKFILDLYGKPLGHKLPKQCGTLILMYLLTTVPIEARDRSRWHRVLTSEVALYFGSIMFGIYLVHGTVLHLFGYVLPYIIWDHIGGNDDMGRYLFGLGIGWVISFIVCLWAADVWTREIESRCTKVAKFIEKICFIKHQ